MPMAVHCSACQTTLNVPDDMAGKRSPCPACGGLISIPAANAVQSDLADALRTDLPAPVAPMSAPSMGSGGSHRTPYARGSFQELFLIIVGIATATILLNLIGYMSTPPPPASQTLEELIQQAKSSDRGDGGTLALVGTIAYWMLVTNVVINCIFLYRAWDIIQDGEARTTPAQAVVFLFIPVFNMYWVFNAFRGLCEDMNQYTKSKGIPARRANDYLMSFGVGLLLASAVFDRFVPERQGFIMVLFTAGNIVFFLALNTVKNTATDIMSAKAA